MSDEVMISSLPTDDADMDVDATLDESLGTHAQTCNCCHQQRELCGGYIKRPLKEITPYMQLDTPPSVIDSVVLMKPKSYLYWQCQ